MTPGESAKRSPAKQLAWLEGGHAVTRRHVLQMHEPSGTSGVFDTHCLVCIKELKDGGSVSLSCAALPVMNA